MSTEVVDLSKLIYVNPEGFNGSMGAVSIRTTGISSINNISSSEDDAIEIQKALDSQSLFPTKLFLKICSMVTTKLSDPAFQKSWHDKYRVNFHAELHEQGSLEQSMFHEFKQYENLFLPTDFSMFNSEKLKATRSIGKFFILKNATFGFMIRFLCDEFRIDFYSEFLSFLKSIVKEEIQMLVQSIEK